jgi:hypothetical protein|nr:MAG TPA: hypothetical protein [Caudoviricetes sp.]
MNNVLFEDDIPDFPPDVIKTMHAMAQASAEEYESIDDVIEKEYGSYKKDPRYDRIVEQLTKIFTDLEDHEVYQVFKGYVPDLGRPNWMNERMGSMKRVLTQALANICYYHDHIVYRNISEDNIKGWFREVVGIPSYQGLYIAYTWKPGCPDKPIYYVTANNGHYSFHLHEGGYYGRGVFYSGNDGYTQILWSPDTEEEVDVIRYFHLALDRVVELLDQKAFV